MRLAAALLFGVSAAAAEPEASRRPARAADVGFSFEWTAPPPCPARSEVVSRAERLIGHAITRVAGEPPIGLVATVQSLPNATWQLSVRSGTGGESQRSVTASSCDELGDAMALLIALSIDPGYAAREGAAPAPEGHAAFADVPTIGPAQPAPSPMPEPASRPIVASAPATVDRSEVPRAGAAAPAHLALGALGAVWVGRLPGAAPGGVLLGALSLREWVLGLEVGFFPKQHVENGAVGADLSLATLEGSLGYALFDGLLRPYAGLELDRLHGVRTDVRPANSGTIWLLALDAGLQFSYPVRPALRLQMGGHVSVLPEKARFHVDPNAELFRPERVGAQFGLGAELRVP